MHFSPFVDIDSFRRFREHDDEAKHGFCHKCKKQYKNLNSHIRDTLRNEKEVGSYQKKDLEILRLFANGTEVGEYIRGKFNNDLRIDSDELHHMMQPSIRPKKLKPTKMYGHEIQTPHAKPFTANSLEALTDTAR